MKLLFIAVFSLCYTAIWAQDKKQEPVSNTEPVKKESKKWYESFSIRGYVQVRYNRLLETNPKLKCEQCDRSIGDGGGFIIRRGRIIISGNIAKNVYFYIQPDFGSSTGTTQNIFQLRDAYFDVGFDKKNEFRLRIGQSKVPFGFENMQSSQNRLPLDRNED
jgi:phosphate-selective porin